MTPAAAQARWDQCIAKFADVSYSWPDAYCCALAHCLLDGRTQYRALERHAGSELRMLADGLAKFKSIGEGHDIILRDADAIPLAPELRARTDGIRIAWVSGGMIHTTRGPVIVASDTRGIMVFYPQWPQDRLVWTQEGLTAVQSMRSATVTRAWKIS